MLFSSLAKWATSVALVAAVLPAASATAEPTGTPGERHAPAEARGAGIGAAASARRVPNLPEVASPTAQQLLDEARSLFTPTAPLRGRQGAGATEATVPEAREASMTLLQLQLRKGELSRAERREVDLLTARPTGSDHVFNYPSGTKPRSTCNDRICVHWTDEGEDAPPRADSDGDTIPDQVETTLTTVESIWRRVVDRGGYKAPKRDKGTKASPHQGPDRRFDVYLGDVGRFNLFGYCTIDPVKLKKVKRKGWDVPGYCVLDDDFSPKQFGSSKSANQLLQVTAAHEFFHAVQFSYDIGEDPWFMEGTAAWVEDELYDDVNDNLTFLGKSQITKPKKPLDLGKNLSVYGSWIWWRFLTERFPGDKGTGLPVIIKQIWNKADASASDPRKRGTFSIRATERVLAARKKKLPAIYAKFGVANRHPSGHYSEGGSYPTVPLLKEYALSADQPRIAEQVATMPHLTNFSVGFEPGSGIGDGWKLVVKVDGPPRKRGSYAQVTVVGKDGVRSTRTVKLSKKGKGKRKVDFARDDVARVELTMTNAGTRYRCNRDTAYSCAGKPRDDGAKFFFKAKAVPKR